jgi:hypothetical protein
MTTPVPIPQAIPQAAPSSTSKAMRSHGDPALREHPRVMGTDFFDVPRATFALEGGSCDLPVIYRDASSFGVFFALDLAVARAAVRATAIEPWPVLGRAVGALYCWEYRDSSIGAYGEVGLGVQCRRVGSHPSLPRLGFDMGAQDDQGIWVVTLPVSTEAAFSAGVQLWGYPKYVSPIETAFRAEGARCKLGDELDVSIGTLGGPALKGQPVVTYTENGGRLIRTRIDVDHRTRWGTGRSAKIEITGDGPTSRAIRELGIDRATPLAAFRIDGFRAILPQGIDLGPSHG